MNSGGSLFSILLSGALGALLATGLGLVFSFWVERVRIKGEVMLAVVSWADETSLRLVDLRTAKNAMYMTDKMYLTQEEYNLNTRELRSQLLRVSVLGRLALVYGEGRETELLNELRKSLLTVARILWVSKKETWSQSDKQVLELFERKIDPLRRELEHDLLRQGSIPMILLGIKGRLAEEPRWNVLEQSLMDEGQSAELPPKSDGGHQGSKQS